MLRDWSTTPTVSTRPVNMGWLYHAPCEDRLPEGAEHAALVVGRPCGGRLRAARSHERGSIHRIHVHGASRGPADQGIVFLGRAQLGPPGAGSAPRVFDPARRGVWSEHAGAARRHRAFRTLLPTRSGSEDRPVASEGLLAGLERTP